MVFIHEKSHIDHVPESVLLHITGRYSGLIISGAVHYETFTLPEGMTLECGLHGPVMGDAPVPESEVFYASRNGRPCLSRLTLRVKRPTRQCTAVFGPFDGHPCVLFTAFGGPLAPREIGDETIRDKEELECCRKFWSEHALSAE